LKVNNFLC